MKTIKNPFNLSLKSIYSYKSNQIIKGVKNLNLISNF
jgi:hypothetical protein